MRLKTIIILVAFIVTICTFSAGCTDSDKPFGNIVLLNEKNKFVVEYTIVDDEIGNQELIEKVYDFSYKGKDWHIVAQVPQYRYDNYVKEKYLLIRDKEYDFEPENQRSFILDEYVTKVVEQFKTQNGVLTDQEMIEVLTYFVQTQIEYLDDDEQYGSEYEAYPMQTLINGKGDCDCRTVLLTGLLYHANYDAISIMMFPTDYNVAHWLVGINCEKVSLDYNAKSIECKGQHYYLIESTGLQDIGTGTFIDTDDVDDWRMVYTKGYELFYDSNVLCSEKDYIKNRKWVY